MCKAKAMKLAAQYGLELDDQNSGKSFDEYTIIFDHPTHTIGGGCCSIVVSAGTAREAWEYAAERIEGECKEMEPCTDPECDYHTGE